MTDGPAPAAPRLAVGDRFTRRASFDADSIRNFATLCGDHNPLHHDERAAAASRFGTLIASGPHVVALMMGLDATFLSREADALGLGFEFRFVKAVPAGCELTLEWTIAGIEYKASLDGDVVNVEGRAIDDAGVVYVTATGRNLVRRSAALRGVDSLRGVDPLR
ncbi:MAG TPA: MaoC family dehydratase [Casimicrobiaceae bacterium]|nr:MaoC family dehydratase [Casimicrobiaceae bacterium]